MALQVRTTHGKKFRRAGLEFGPEPTFVDEETLHTVISPGNPKKGIQPIRVGDAIVAEPMLVSVCVPDVPAKEGPVKEEPKQEAPVKGDSKKK